MAKNNFKKIHSDIVSFIKRHEYRAFSTKALYSELERMHNEWNLYASYTGKKFIQYLDDKQILERKDFRDQDGRVRAIYHQPKLEHFSIYMGLRRNSYYTHYTAMYMNQLTLQIPKTHYLNFEHYSEQEFTPLTQNSIDQAFNKPQRKTSQFFTFQGERIMMINGKHTEKLGVLKIEGKNSKYEYTDIERTLIDIAIRPVYAGGVFEVLEAYQSAKGRVDVMKLKEYLTELNYIYPYHQVIGFYLEKAGYSEVEYQLFQNDIEFKFYLTYSLKKPEFDNKWNLWYPKGF